MEADPSRWQGKRLYPALVFLTALAIGALGLYPHLHFSLDNQSLEYFFYSYDEGFYNTMGLEAGRTGRTLSPAAISGLIRLCGGDVETALVAADFLFPFLAVLLAGLLAATVARTIPGRLALLLGLLFAAEFATHLFTSWIPPWDQLVEGPWRTFVVQAPQILYLFRTPEPQISWLVAFLFLALLNTLGRDPDTAPGRATTLLFFAASVLLGLSYGPILIGCTLYAALFLLTLARTRERRLAAVLLGGILLSANAFLASLAASAKTMTGAVLFETSLPVISPLTLVSLGMSALWILRFALTRELSRGAMLGGLASVTPVILMNQQLLTGRAITFKTWEESSSHIFVALGIAWFFGTLPLFGRRPPQWGSRAAQVVAAALLGTAILLFAVERQRESVEWYYAVNAEEAAAAALLDEHYGMIDEEVEVLFDRVTMTQRLGIRSRNRYQPVLSFDEGFLAPVPTLEADAARTGTGSAHAEAVYEFMWRRGVSVRAFEARLLEEARGHALVLTLFFSHLDAWGPLTSWRKRQGERIASRIPAIVAEYGEYRRVAAAGEPPPVYWVSLQAPHEVEANEDFLICLVDRREAADGRVLHLYRQTSRGAQSC